MTVRGVWLRTCQLWSTNLPSPYLEVKLTIWNIRSRPRSLNFDFRAWATRKVRMARMTRRRRKMTASLRRLEVARSRKSKAWRWRSRIKDRAIRRPESVISKMVREMMSPSPVIKNKRSSSGEFWPRCQKRRRWKASLIDWRAKAMSKNARASRYKLKILTTKLNKKSRKMMIQARSKNKWRTSKDKMDTLNFQMKIWIRLKTANSCSWIVRKCKRCLPRVQSIFTICPIASRIKIRYKKYRGWMCQSSAKLPVRPKISSKANNMVVVRSKICHSSVVSHPYIRTTKWQTTSSQSKVSVSRSHKPLHHLLKGRGRQPFSSVSQTKTPISRIKTHHSITSIKTLRTWLGFSNTKWISNIFKTSNSCRW